MIMMTMLMAGASDSIERYGLGSYYWLARPVVLVLTPLRINVGFVLDVNGIDG